MKLVAAIRMKNEEWIIKYTLSALSEFVDSIVVVDDGSTDRSVAIAQSYPKVKKIHINNPKNEDDIDEPRDWNKLTKLAIEEGADWILYTDADEMIEPKIKYIIQELLIKKEAGVFQFRKISPWKGLEKYRTDQFRYNHPAKNVLNPILIKANKNLFWDNGRGNILIKIIKRIIRGEKAKPNYGRVFPKNTNGKIICMNDVVSIHYNHIDQNRLLKKQVFYALREMTVRPDKSKHEIIEWVARGWSEVGATYEKINQDWLWENYLSLIQYEKSN